MTRSERVGEERRRGDAFSEHSGGTAEKKSRPVRPHEQSDRKRKGEGGAETPFKWRDLNNKTGGREEDISLPDIQVARKKAAYSTRADRCGGKGRESPGSTGQTPQQRNEKKGSSPDFFRRRSQKP